MKLYLRLLLILVISTQAYAVLANTTCKKCHPKIYKEYQNSIHSQSSIYKDAVHKAVWDRHPDKAKNNYKCAKCHSPSDHDLITGTHKLSDNEIQQTEPISCQTCHTIQSVEKHSKANKNHFIDKKKYFYSANKAKKGTKVIFKEESHLLGMFKTKIGSPYHDIDYTNEGYYNGDICMGCHAHKQNAKGLAVCDMEVKQGDSKETCISCHMPKVQGSLANQKHSLTHAFHGISIHSATPKELSKYITLSLTQKKRILSESIADDAVNRLVKRKFAL